MKLLWFQDPSDTEEATLPNTLKLEVFKVTNFVQTKVHVELITGIVGSVSDSGEEANLVVQSTDAAQLFGGIDAGMRRWKYLKFQ